VHAGCRVIFTINPKQTHVGICNAGVGGPAAFNQELVKLSLQVSCNWVSGCRSCNAMRSCAMALMQTNSGTGRAAFACTICMPRGSRARHRTKLYKKTHDCHIGLHAGEVCWRVQHEIVILQFVTCRAAPTVSFTIHQSLTDRKTLCRHCHGVSCRLTSASCMERPAHMHSSGSGRSERKNGNMCKEAAHRECP